MKSAFTLIALALVLYLAASATAWKIRNPLGNDWTFWIYFPAPLYFEKIDSLQAKE